MASNCNPPSLNLTVPTVDILALIAAALADLGIPIPTLPTIPAVPPFCPLDDL